MMLLLFLQSLFDVTDDDADDDDDGDDDDLRDRDD